MPEETRIIAGPVSANGDNMSAVAESQKYADQAIAAAAEREKARLQLSFFVAASRPRNEEQARSRILQNCHSRDFAVKAIYAKPVGGEKIEDLSIRFVEMALREWGNVLTEATVVHEDERGRRVRVSALDLQTNTAFTREIYVARAVERSRLDDGRTVIGQRKNSKGRVTYRVLATDDEMDLLTNSAVSKALRNEGGRLLPEDLKEESRKAIRAVLSRETWQDIITYRRSILDAFARLGIQPADLEKVIGHSLGTTTAKELQGMEVIYHTLSSGEATWADYALESRDEAAPLAKRISEAKERISATAGDPGSAGATPREDPEPEEKPRTKQKKNGVDKLAGSQSNQACSNGDDAVESACYFCGGEPIAADQYGMPDGTTQARCRTCREKMNGTITQPDLLGDKGEQHG